MPARNADKPATRGDVKRLDEKIDASVDRLDKKIDASVERLDKKIDRVAVEVVKTGARIEALEGSLRKEMTQNTHRILNAVDSFARKAEAYDRAAIIHGDVLGKHDEKLLDHEKRLASVESKA